MYLTELLNRIQYEKTFHCPHCKSKEVNRKGVRRGNIKFVCKACNKWFQIRRGRKSLSGKDVLNLHLVGTSYRNIGRIASRTGSSIYRLSSSTISSLPHCADITRKYCSHFCGVLLVDGKYVKVKGYERKIPVFYGIDYLTHDIPTYIFSPAENYQTCLSFFSSLRLLKYPLQAIVCDDNINIQQACRQIYPNAVIQLCQNHYKQSIRVNLGIHTNTCHYPFMRSIEELFERKRSRGEFLHNAGNMFQKYGYVPEYKSILLDINRRMDVLCSYMNHPHVPRTNNLIESYNSHLESRLKTLKGFKSFSHADDWLNAYFIHRRSKTFTDCEGKFKRLNGFCSLQKTMKNPSKLSDILRLIR